MTWPEKPEWNNKLDRFGRNRFTYQDYDGESVHIHHDEEGHLWIETKGAGPTFITKEHIHLILSAVRGN